MNIIFSPFKTLLKCLIRQRYKADPLRCASLLINWRAVGPFRKHYALGMILAAAQAECLGLKTTTIVEFGVGTGGGLLDMCQIAEFLKSYTPVNFNIVGFDTGEGLPEPEGFRDHPEIWASGLYAINKDDVTKQLPANAQILFGDVKDTLKTYLKQDLTSSAPVGFVSLDLDYYSSSKEALALLNAEVDCLLPAIPIYVDDIDVVLSYNSKCGEALAINEFNENNESCHIEKKYTAVCPERFYVCHVLKHPVRTGEIKAQKPLAIQLRLFSVGLNPRTW